MSAAAARVHRIAVIPGDGIGLEVTPQALSVLEAAAAAGGFTLEIEELPWGSDYHARHGEMMPEDGLERLARFDAILLGAVGSPEVPDHVPVRGLVLPIRRHFDQYVNLRPMRLLAGVDSPLAGRTAADVDMICVRENSEGEYSGEGGRSAQGTAGERAEQTATFTRAGIERVARYAFELAASRPRKLLASATKSNALQHSMVFWDEVVREVGAGYPQVRLETYHVDALAARMVSDPGSLDTIVASNLFGDILTDLGAAVSGSMGLAPSANLNPERDSPSMFEPIHGSAPDIAGKGIANPIGAIWAAAMMLEHLGEREGHRRTLAAVETVLAAGRARTPDLGGSATCAELGGAIRAAVAETVVEPPSDPHELQT